MQCVTFKCAPNAEGAYGCYLEPPSAKAYCEWILKEAIQGMKIYVGKSAVASEDTQAAQRLLQTIIDRGWGFKVIKSDPSAEDDESDVEEMVRGCFGDDDRFHTWTTYATFEGRSCFALELPNVSSNHHLFSVGDAESRRAFIVLQEGCAPALSVAPASGRQAAKIIADIAPALRRMHECNIVHKDIKPDNIVLCGDRYKLIDFGLAQKMGDGPPDRGGTPYYMSPFHRRLIVSGDPPTDKDDKDDWDAQEKFMRLMCGEAWWREMDELAQKLHAETTRNLLSRSKGRANETMAFMMKLNDRFALLLSALELENMPAISEKENPVCSGFFADNAATDGFGLAAEAL